MKENWFQTDRSQINWTILYCIIYTLSNVILIYINIWAYTLANNQAEEGKDGTDS